MIGDYQVPTDVKINEIRSTEQGRLIVAGRQGPEENTQVWFNLLTVDESGVVSEVWPEARIDGNGEATAIDSEPSGGFVLAGFDPGIDSKWLQRYHESGAPLWPQRVGGCPEDDETAETGVVSEVSIQSDGSIFLSAGSEAFVYCEQ